MLLLVLGPAGRLPTSIFGNAEFQNTYVFWGSADEGRNFGLLGRIEEERQAAQHLLTLKPVFPDRGRVLIEHYIKFEEIVERVKKVEKRVMQIFGLEKDVIYSKGRRRIQVADRSLLCYWAVRELGLTAT